MMTQGMESATAACRGSRRRSWPPATAGSSATGSCAGFPGDPGVHRAVQQQRTRGDDHIVQAHGQNRRRDQGVAEADQPFDQIASSCAAKINSAVESVIVCSSRFHPSLYTIISGGRKRHSAPAEKMDSLFQVCVGRGIPRQIDKRFAGEFQ